jgi:hypothetical protein
MPRAIEYGIVSQRFNVRNIQMVTRTPAAVTESEKESSKPCLTSNFVSL